MNPLLAFGLLLSTLAAGAAAAQSGGFTSGQGNLRSKPGNFGAGPGGYQAPAGPPPSFGRPAPLAAPRTPRVQPFQPFQPFQPIVEPAPVGPQTFQPYENVFPESSRGGVDPYPAPARPKPYKPVF